MRTLSTALALILFTFTLSIRLPAQTFRADKLAAMDPAIEAAIASNKCPGGVLWLEHDGAVYEKAFGDRSIVPDARADDRGHDLRYGIAHKSRWRLPRPSCS